MIIANISKHTVLYPFLLFNQMNYTVRFTLQDSSIVMIISIYVYAMRKISFKMVLLNLINDMITVDTINFPCSYDEEHLRQNVSTLSSNITLSFC